MTKPPNLRDHTPRLRWTNLWLVPVLCVAGVLVMFVITQAIDHAHHAGTFRLPHWLDQGGPTDARDLLSATAGALITTLGLVLSITVLTLSIAASQFGQRMLRRYMRDRGTQFAIGVFAATFVFSLLTLLSVASPDVGPRREYVPWLSVWMSTLLAVSCIGVLIYFVHHIAQIIQVNIVVAEISADLRDVIAHRIPGQHGPAAVPDPAQADFQLVAPCAGYLRRIEYPAFVTAAARYNVVIRFLRRPGQFVLQGSAVATVLHAGRELDVAAAQHALNRVFYRSMKIGPQRSPRQDTTFPIDQLVEIALHAMSPAVNDPNTMYLCVDWLTDCLRAAAQAQPARSIYTDLQGRARVIAVTESFDDLVHAAFDPLRVSARHSVDASVRLLEAMQMLAPCLQPDQVPELRHQADLIRADLSPDFGAADRMRAEATYQRAARALAERVPGSARARMIGP
jgi:uncharacterized membrane protein